MSESSRYGFRCIAIALCLVGGVRIAIAEGTCPTAEVIEHVKEQIRIYGPQSRKREFFGFIYRDGDVLRSSVVRGPICDNSFTCSVHSRGAAEGLPPGVKVLGEWHTHPSGDGSHGVSAGDVRGAWNNRKIRCYTAYYAASNGNFYSWNPANATVPGAMRSRVHLGDYRKPDTGPVIIAAHQVPGSTCLSTNTNARTAATTMKSCRKSPTSR